MSEDLTVDLLRVEAQIQGQTEDRKTRRDLTFLLAWIAIGILGGEFVLAGMSIYFYPEGSVPDWLTTLIISTATFTIGTAFGSAISNNFGSTSSSRAKDERTK